MYDLSKRPDLTESIPLPLSAQGERARAYSSDKRFDVIVNGMGFNLWADPQHPYRRGADQVQKEQFDNSKEAGEQTLGGPWIRSQTSWHMGAGIDFYEPGSEPDTQYRFKASHGVDVWTEGQASLLPEMDADVTGLTDTGRVVHYRHDGADGYVLADGASVGRYTADGTLAASYDDGGSLSGLILGPVTGVAGRTYHAQADGIFYLDWSGGSTPSVTAVRTLSDEPTCMAIVKHRFVVGSGRTLTWVAWTGAGGALGEGDDLTIHTHPHADWVWTGLAESPDSILAYGNDGISSRVYSIGVSMDETPEFESPIEVLRLPAGEIITDLQTYLGTYLVAATTAGIRVGLLGQGGQIQVGPLSVDRPGTSVAFWDRFAYVGVTEGLEDGSSGVIRLDLSAPVGETDLYAWACDVSTGTGDLTSVTVLPDGTPLTVAGDSLYRPTGDLLSSGWLETGRIRFATTEKKDFQRVAVAGTLNGGSVDVDALVGATTQRVVSYDPATGSNVETEIRVGSTSLFREMAFRLTLNRDGDLSPAVESMAVKAEPAVNKTRLLDIPLACGNFETNRDGLVLGYEQPGQGGFGLDRLLELEELESRNEPLVIEDNRTGEAFVGTIVSVEFTSLHNPDRMHGNTAGWIGLVVRKR